MAKRTTYEITEPVRGEMRVDADVLVYDLTPGPVPADLDKRVLDRLIGDRLAIETKKETTR